MESLPLINKTYEVYKFTIDINNHLPKRHRFSLGVSVENTVLTILENLIMAKNAPTPMKLSYLIRTDALLEVARLKFRLFLELDLVNETKIFQIQAILQEIGRMIGGWINSLQSK